LRKIRLFRKYNWFYQRFLTAFRMTGILGQIGKGKRAASPPSSPFPKV